MRTSGVNINKIFDRKLNNNRIIYPYEKNVQYHNYNLNNTNYFDTDSLKDDLIKTRFEFNKLNQSYQDLKFSYIKLDNE